MKEKTYCARHQFREAVATECTLFICVGVKKTKTKSTSKFVTVGAWENQSHGTELTEFTELLQSAIPDGCGGF